jgi:hypothetical protein
VAAELALPGAFTPQGTLISTTVYVYTGDEPPTQGGLMSNVTAPVRKAALTTWEGIWYVLQCIAFGAGYFAKVPAKKALSDFGLVEMTAAEQFWYVVQNIFFGSGYFAKIPTAKALSELPQYRTARQTELGTAEQTQQASQE